MYAALTTFSLERAWERARKSALIGKAGRKEAGKKDGNGINASRENLQGELKILWFTQYKSLLI